MIRLNGNRLFCILITVFTVLAILGNFYFGAAEFPRAVEFGAFGTGSADGTVDRFIPSPAGEPVLLIKTEDPQFTPSRTGFQRIFNSGRTHGMASAFYQPWFGIHSLFNCTDIKNTILLKLRI